MLISLFRRLCEANPDFISSLAGGSSDAGSDDAEDAGEGGPGPGEGEGSEGGDTAAAEARQNGAHQGSPSGQPAADAGRDHLSNLNAALREVRGENKQLKDQLAQISARLEQLGKPAAAPPEPEPDFLEDPRGVVDKLAKRLDESEKQRKDREEAEAKQREQHQKASQTWGKMLSAESEFVAKTPDYHDALAHIRSVRTQQLQMMHPEATAQQIAQHIQGEEFQGASALIAQGKNPSEFYYNYAKTYGYKPKPPPAPGADGTAPPKVDKEAARSMGSGGGNPIEDKDERSGGLSELGAAHAEMKEERKKSARNR